MSVSRNRAFPFVCFAWSFAVASCSSGGSATYTSSDAGGAAEAGQSGPGPTNDASATGDANPTGGGGGTTGTAPGGEDAATGNPDAATGNPDAATGNPDAGTVSHPVSCASLSGVVGTWQDVSPAAFYMPANLETLAVAVNPQDETVYAAAGNVTNGGACPQGSTCPSMGTGIYKSSDCGATWTPITTTTPGTDSANLLTGDPWALLIDPVEPSVMYMDNGYGNNPTIYKSTNGGVDWKALNPDPAKVVGTPYPFVQAIAIDPFNHSHLAVTFHENCAAPYHGLCLSESDDGGNTWKEFNGPPPIQGWQEGASVNIIGPTHYIFVGPGGIWYTGDTGAQWTELATQSITASYAGATHIASDGTLYVGGGSDVLFSPPAPNMVPPFAIGKGTPSLSVLPQSPGVTFIVDDGVNLFASPGYGSSAQEFFTAPVSAPSSWKQMPDSICGPTIGSYTGQNCRGANEMAYDGIHHVVYSANWHSGLWRLVTR
jgi:hypothetical protein